MKIKAYYCIRNFILSLLYSFSCNAQNMYPIDNYGRLTNNKCSGYDVTLSQKQLTVNGCAVFCNNSPTCVAFEYIPTHSNNEYCWPKSKCDPPNIFLLVPIFDKSRDLYRKLTDTVPGYDFAINKICAFNNIGLSEQISLTACIDKCNHDGNCIGINYCPNGLVVGDPLYCWPKTICPAPSTLGESITVNTYIKLKVLPNYDLTQDSFCSGNDIGSAQTKNLASDCAVHCENSANCTHFIHIPRNISNNCVAKSQCINPVRVVGRHIYKRKLGTTVPIQVESTTQSIIQPSTTSTTATTTLLASIVTTTTTVAQQSTSNPDQTTTKTSDLTSTTTARQETSTVASSTTTVSETINIPVTSTIQTSSNRVTTQIPVTSENIVTTGTPATISTVTTDTPTTSSTVMTETPTTSSTVTTDTPTTSSTVLTHTPTTSSTVTTHTPTTISTVTTHTPTTISTVTTHTPTTISTVTTHIPTTSSTVTTHTQTTSSTVTTHTPTTISTVTTHTPTTSSTVTTHTPTTISTVTTHTPTTSSTVTTQIPTTSHGVTTQISTTRSTKPMTSSTHETTTTESLTTQAPNSVEISCAENCAPVKRISSSLVLTARCNGMCSSRNSTVIWNLTWTDTSSGNVHLYNLLTISDAANNMTLWIKPGTLKSGMQHTAMVKIINLDGQILQGIYTFLTNQPPNGGVCVVQPNQGYALSNIFSIRCTNFSEANSNLLKYKFSVKSGSLEVVVFYGHNESAVGLMFPAGNPANGYMIDVITQIVDANGDFTDLQNQVKVLPSTLNSQTQHNTFSSNLNLTIRNYNDAAEVLLRSKSIQQIFPRDNALQNALKEAYTNLADSVIYLPLTNTVQLQQMISIYQLILADIGQVNGHIQECLSTGLIRMVKFIETNAATMTWDEQHKIISGLVMQTFYIFEAASNVVQQNNFTQANVELQQIKNSSETLQTVTDQLGKVLFKIMITDGPNVAITTNQSALILSKTTMSKGIASTVADFSGNVVKIVPKDNACLQTQVGINFVNPYLWDNSSTQVTTPVIGINTNPCSGPFKRKKRSLAKVDYVDAQLVSKSTQAPYIVNVQYHPDQLVYHSIQLSDQNYPVVVSVNPYYNQSLEVYMGYDSSLNTSNYDMLYNVPENTSSIHISPQMLKQNNASAVFIAVRKYCTGSCNNINLTYSYQIAQLSCLQWDTLSNKWQTFGCDVQPSSTPAKQIFKCRLLGSLGAGVFVGPNTIDFSSVFNNLGQKIIDNIAVFITVLGVIVLYIPLAVLCRRLDKKDKYKWETLPLADNVPGNAYSCGKTYSYEVHVYTGTKGDAGTTSNVEFILAGTENDSGTRKLDDGERQNFQRGDVNSFLMHCPNNLGIPVTIKIWHDNSGKKADWYLSKIVVVDVDKQKWYLFLCDEWLSYDQGEGTIQRILHLFGSSDSETGSSLLQNNFGKMLASDHIWLSVAYRKARSTFTRVQRLSCCLATLLLTMVASAMWYGTGDTGQGIKSAINIGPISLTVHQVYTSVMSCLIVAPPILLITVLYEKTDNSTNTICSKGSAISKKIQKKVKTKMLPHWCLFIAHFVVFLSVAASAFFTILYAFQWGKQKSEAWLGTIALSVVQSILFIQPLKIILVVILYSIWFKKDADTSYFEEKIGKKEIPDPGIEPANENILREVRALRNEEKTDVMRKTSLDKTMNKLFFEVLRDVIFIFLILWTLMGNQDTNVYLQNNNLKQEFTTTLIEVKSRPQAWEWMNEVLLPNLYARKQLSQSPTLDKFTASETSIRIGAPRLRQGRTTQEKCHVIPILKTQLPHCSNDLVLPWIDTHNYKPKWIAIQNITYLDTTPINVQNAFTYKSPSADKSLSFWGRLGWYPAGGYIFYLKNKFAYAVKDLKDLKDNNWIDRYTRVVFVEFNTWNPNTRLFSFVTISLEFPTTGGTEYWIDIQSIQLYQYTGGAGLLNIIIELVTVIVMLVFLIKEIIKIVKERTRYFKGFWNIISLLLYTSFFLAVGLYTWRCILTVSTLQQVLNNRDKTISFSVLTTAHMIFITCLGITAFLLEMRLLSALRYLNTIAVLAKTLLQSAGQLCGVGFLFGIIVFAFALYNFLAYGTLVSDYRSIHSALDTVTVITLSFRTSSQFARVSGTFGTLTTLTYTMFMLLIVLNVLVAIINDFLSALKDDEEITRNHEVIDYIINMFKKLLPGKEKDDNDDTKKQQIK